MSDDPLKEALKSIARDMTRADLSILKAAVDDLNPGRPTLLSTTPGSNNDRLWSQMAALGWMEHSDSLELPVQSRVYRIDPAAREQIAEFVADTLRADAIIAAVNELRATVPPKLIERVHAADGRPLDLAMMLAGIVEATMRRAIKPDLHDEFLREVARLAQQMRAL
jgi:hypothetical protein